MQLALAIYDFLEVHAYKVATVLLHKSLDFGMYPVIGGDALVVGLIPLVIRSIVVVCIISPAIISTL